MQLADRIERLRGALSAGGEQPRTTRIIITAAPTCRPSRSRRPGVLPEPLKLSGGLRILVHGDPTFMVMDNLKRQFEQVIGTQIHQRAFSIDRLREEALRNAERGQPLRHHRVDLPWIGEFAEKGMLMPLDEIMDVARLDPADFHTAGWQAAHWGGRPYGVPAQTTPELLFYRKDWFASAGLEPPTTDRRARGRPHFHAPRRGATASPGTRRAARAGPYLHDDLRRFRPADHRPARIAGGFDADIWPTATIAR